MKPFYLLLSLLVFISCDKDVDEQIVGTWTITEVDEAGVGNSIPAGLPFKDGTISLHQDGSAFYTNGSGLQYSGKWTFERKRQGDETFRTLLISVVHYPTQQILMDAFDDVVFVRTNYFKGEASFDNKRYITHFKR